MARFFRRPRSSGQLRDQLIRQLENEAQKLLKQMVQDFSRDLASESQRVLKDSLRSFGSGGDGISGQSFSNLLSTAVNYVVSRPRSRSDTRESARSVAAAQQFRLSRSQAAAEAGASLARGERNF